MSILFYILVLVSVWFVLAVEKIRYISLEHPFISYIDKDFISYANLTAKRYGRHNPVYYVGLNITMKVPLDKNIMLDFYFYELLSNVYKRSFVEIHYNFCDLMEKDIFFGPTVKQQACFKGSCPFPPNNYNLVNMSIPPASIPLSFPFMKGRIAMNMTRFKKVIGAGHMDMEIKEFRKKDETITFAKV